MLDAPAHEQGIGQAHQQAIEAVFEGAHKLAATLRLHAFIGQQQVQTMTARARACQRQAG